MENLFVPYEQSLSLKELGFDEPCFGFYTYKSEIRRYTNFDGELNDFQTIKNSKITMGDNWATSPTFSQAFKFIREKYNLIGLVEGGYDNGKNIFTYVIWDGFKDNMFDEYFETYEEAELTCLNELIKLVKTK